jgi:hypothetical protein
VTDGLVILVSWVVFGLLLVVLATVVLRGGDRS